MTNPSLNIVVLGLSITSSWGNGHATTFRGLIRELSKRGHKVMFLERDMPWYATNRDLPNPSFCKTILYQDLRELKALHAAIVKEADLLIVGSYVPEGVEVGHFVVNTAEGVTAFYDIDTPVTLAKMERGDYEYIDPALVSKYNLYLSFTGGSTLRRIEEQYGSPRAEAFYCSFDPEVYYPEFQENLWDLGYLGTYSDDRQPPLEKLMLEAAKEMSDGRFVVAGPQYPEHIKWSGNVERIEHLPPSEHRKFYNSQRFTLNITRDDMIRAGYSPSVRLFEAAACGIPIISDYWEGIESIFDLDTEILISYSAKDTLRYIKDIPEATRKSIGERARAKVMQQHTAAHRAIQLEQHYQEVLWQRSKQPEAMAS